MAWGLRGGKARSIAQRLFVSAILWSVALLLVAGVIISDIYRRTTEQAFDQRLDVYLRAIVADVATPGTISGWSRANWASRNSS